MISRKLLLLASSTACATALAFGFAATAAAEDLSDNATCLECHADEPRAAPENSDQPEDPYRRGRVSTSKTTKCGPASTATT